MNIRRRGPDSISHVCGLIDRRVDSSAISSSRRCATGDEESRVRVPVSRHSATRPKGQSRKSAVPETRSHERTLRSSKGARRLSVLVKRGDRSPESENESMRIDYQQMDATTRYVC